MALGNRSNKKVQGNQGRWETLSHPAGRLVGRATRKKSERVRGTAAGGGGAGTAGAVPIRQAGARGRP